MDRCKITYIFSALPVDVDDNDEMQGVEQQPSMGALSQNDAEGQEEEQQQVFLTLIFFNYFVNLINFIFFIFFFLESCRDK